MADKRKKLKTYKTAEGGQQYMSPRAKAITAKEKKTHEALNKILPSKASRAMRHAAARATGTQAADSFVASVRVRANERYTKKKTQTRKPSK